MKTNSFLLTTAAMAAGLVMSSAALAQSTATGTLNAKIVITKDCAVTSSGTVLDFGSKASTVAVAATASTAITVKCTNLTPYKIGLQSSAASSATDGTGTMKYNDGSTVHTIGYQLNQASGGTPWGNVYSGTTNTQGGTGSGSDQSYTVYGATTSTLNVAAGTYEDTVNISVYY